MAFALMVAFVAVGSARSELFAPKSGLEITVWKSPACGFRGKWVEPFEGYAFDVTAVKVRAMSLMNSNLGIQSALQPIHREKVDGYQVERHALATVILKPFDERPAICGLAVPGMPTGSLGMEAGEQFDAFEVLAFADNSVPVVLSRHERPGWRRSGAGSDQR